MPCDTFATLHLSLLEVGELRLKGLGILGLASMAKPLTRPFPERKRRELEEKRAIRIYSQGFLETATACEVKVKLFCTEHERESLLAPAAMSRAVGQCWVSAARSVDIPPQNFTPKLSVT